MRFLSYARRGGRGLGVALDGGLLGLAEDRPTYPGSLDDLVSAGGDHLARAHQEIAGSGEALDAAAIDFLPPLARSSKIICVGLNYRDHARESGHSPPSYPTLFARFQSSLIGHGQPIVRPDVSDTLDFEGELVAIVGRSGRHIAAKDALDHIIGYSIFNDASVREFQHKTPQWTVGKNFDRTGAFGPFFITADELPPGGKGSHLTTRLNGEIVQSASTDAMIFDVATLVSTISEAMTLLPGDLIVTGTPAGVGSARKPPLYMRPGDVCEVEIERMGVLRNAIVAEGAR